MICTGMFVNTVHSHILLVSYNTRCHMADDMPVAATLIDRINKDHMRELQEQLDLGGAKVRAAPNDGAARDMPMEPVVIGGRSGL